MPEYFVEEPLVSDHRAPVQACRRAISPLTISITHSWPCTEYFTKDKHPEHYTSTIKAFPCQLQKWVTRILLVKEMSIEATQQWFYCCLSGKLYCVCICLLLIILWYPNGWYRNVNIFLEKFKWLSKSIKEYNLMKISFIVYVAYLENLEDNTRDFLINY